MTSQRLLSAVYVLEAERPFSSAGQYMGRAAQKIALGLVGQLNATLASTLHNYDGISPFTVSDLFQSSADYHWLRLTGLRDDVIEALCHIDQSMAYDGWQVRQALMEQHDWTGDTTVASLINTYWRSQRHLKIQFETTTSVKHKGLYRPVPDATLIFKSLFTRWQALVDPVSSPLPYSPEIDVLDIFLMYGLSIRDYQIAVRHIPMKNAPIQGFRGTVDFRVEPPTRALKRLAKRGDDQASEALAHYEALSRLMTLLAAFGFYSGIGIKTAQGMGMMRCL